MSDTSSNWGLVGHEWAVQSLQHDLNTGHIKHAYLILGPQGVGKSTLALAFARALLCGDAGRDTRCDDLVRAEAHPDLSLIAPEISGKVIKTAKIPVATIRELIYTLNLRPIEAQRRVAIIRDFDAAAPPAANALLKTLEEPPGQTVIILTAEHQDQLLPTITSRCERLTLRPLAITTVEAALRERWQVPADHAATLAHLSGGRLGWAVSNAEDEQTHALRRQHLDAMHHLLGASVVQRFAYANTLAGDRETLTAALDTWASWWRDVLLLSSGSRSALVNIDDRDQLRRAGSAVPPDAAAGAIRAIRQTQTQLAQNANARLALEVLLLKLPHADLT